MIALHLWNIPHGGEIKSDDLCKSILKLSDVGLKFHIECVTSSVSPQILQNVNEEEKSLLQQDNETINGHEKKKEEIFGR